VHVALSYCHAHVASTRRYMFSSIGCRKNVSSSHRGPSIGEVAVRRALAAGPPRANLSLRVRQFHLLTQRTLRFLLLLYRTATTSALCVAVRTLVTSSAHPPPVRRPPATYSTRGLHLPLAAKYDSCHFTGTSLRFTKSISLPFPPSLSFSLSIWLFLLAS
jgi:hypothetical protein